MSDKIKIDHPIKIEDNSVERVAFDLMEKIGLIESNKGYYGDHQKKRDYWLKLYSQCHRVVSYDKLDIDQMLKEQDV